MLPTHRIFFGPTGQHLAEVALTSDQLQHAQELLQRGEGVLLVEGETIVYRIAGRALVAIVEIPPASPAEEKPVVMMRVDFSTRPPRVIALDPVRQLEAEQVSNVLTGYLRAGLTTTEGAARLQTLNLPFTLELDISG